jgi:uncharacterized membrane protein (DUF373 family)
MEFGALIPLFYISLCCLYTTPIIGIVGWVLIRFSKKDIQLSRNILISVLVITAIWMLYPVVSLFVFSIYSYKVCPDRPFEITSEILRATIGYGLRRILPGLATGFAFAFIIVVPITLLLRNIKIKNKSNERTVEDDF